MCWSPNLNYEQEQTLEIKPQDKSHLFCYLLHLIGPKVVRILELQLANYFNKMAVKRYLLMVEA